MDRQFQLPKISAPEKIASARYGCRYHHVDVAVPNRLARAHAEETVQNVAFTMCCSQAVTLLFCAMVLMQAREAA
jgi:hypothetical protein